MSTDSRLLLSVLAKTWSDQQDELRSNPDHRAPRYMYESADGSVYVLTRRERRNMVNRERNRKRREKRALEMAQESSEQAEIEMQKSQAAAEKARRRAAELSRRAARLEELRQKSIGGAE